MTVINTIRAIFNAFIGRSTHSMKSAVTVKKIEYRMINFVIGSD